MTVEIVPVGILRPRFPASEPITAALAGQTVLQVLAAYGVEADLVAMVLINGEMASKDAVLREGDVVKLVPFVGGG